jgi:hypothetical protein
MLGVDPDPVQSMSGQQCRYRRAGQLQNYSLGGFSGPEFAFLDVEAHSFGSSMDSLLMPFQLSLEFLLFTDRTTLTHYM